MKKTIVFSLIIFSFLSAYSQQWTDMILGSWISGDGDGKIEIYKKDNKYYGKLIWLKEPYEDDGKTPKVDDENPDASKQHAPLIGLVILKGFSFEEGYWQGGTIYDPANGKTYKCEMWLDGKNNLKIRGYWGIVHRTETWTRTS